MDLKKQEDHLVQLIKRLINGDYYTSKSTAAAIIAGIYPRMKKFDFIKFSLLIHFPNRHEQVFF